MTGGFFFPPQWVVVRCWTHHNRWYSVGLVMGWFKRRERADERLLRAFLQTDAKRIEAAALVDAKKSELELRRLELEMEHIEALGEERRKDAREREANRAARRAAAAAAREKGAAKRAAAAGQGDFTKCRVCADPSSASLTPDEIWWHGSGHPEGGPRPIEWPQ